MVEVNEFVEHMEHVGHAGHAGHAEHEAHAGQNKDPKLGKFIGISMACLGVLLALSTALGGSQKTELLTSMVQQTNSAMKSQAISTKYRTMVAQLTQLDALCPDPKVFAKLDGAVKSIASSHNTQETAKMIRVVRIENAKNLNAEIPTHSDMMVFVTAIRLLEKERNAAEAYTDSFEPAIKGHEKAAEQFEWAQLCCEISIVVASISLLFLRREVWYTSLTMGATALIIVVITFLQAGSELKTANGKIAQAERNFIALNSEARERQSDERLLKSIEQRSDLPVASNLN